MNREEVIREVFNKFLDVLNGFEDISAKRLIYEAKWEFKELNNVDFRDMLAESEERCSKAEKSKD